MEGLNKRARLGCLFSTLPTDVIKDVLLKHVSPLSYYCLLLASKSFYEKMVKDTDRPLNFIDLFEQRLLAQLAAYLGNPKRVEMLFKYLKFADSTHLCGGFLLAVLHGEPTHFTDLYIVRTGFTKLSTIFHPEVSDKLSRIENTEKIPFERNDETGWGCTDLLLRHFYVKNQPMTLLNSDYGNDVIKAVIQVDNPTVQFIYHTEYKTSVPDFHFEFCRVSYGGGKLHFNGYFHQVVTKHCVLDVVKSFYLSPYFETAKCVAKAKACIEKYHKRGYTFTMKPFKDAYKLFPDNELRRRIYQLYQGEFFEHVGHMMTNTVQLIPEITD